MPSVPDTSHVDETTRRKIRRGEFVDFKVLIPPPSGVMPAKRYTFSDGGLEEIADDTHLAFYHWIDAFFVFASIRAGFYPNEFQGLLRHGQIVRSIHSDGKDGVEYDVKYRRLMTVHSDLRWGEYLSQLALTAKEIKPAARKDKNRPGTSGWSASRKGVCFRYNSADGCRLDSCRFPHKCRKCGSLGHPMTRCLRR